ncbi:MAG: hypothetical protein PWP45_298 [Tepidanaerobacteraceae bacterium]|nr:hypothetical protein [Tepidanaerobacteraceae bacterium]
MIEKKRCCHAEREKLEYDAHEINWVVGNSSEKSRKLVGIMENINEISQKKQKFK